MDRYPKKSHEVRPPVGRPARRNDAPRAPRWEGRPSRPQGDFARPPRRDDGPSKPRSEDRPSRPQGDYARPPRRDDGGSRPPRDDSPRPPRDDNTGRSPRDNKTSRPSRKDDSDRPRREDSGFKRPQRDDAGGRPPRRDQSDRPPRNDSGRPPQRDDRSRKGRNDNWAPRPPNDFSTRDERAERPLAKTKVAPVRDEGVSASGEIKYHGFNACEALWKNRAIDIIRVYVEQERLKDFGSLLKWCAKQKKAYHVCTSADLEKISQSVHHEGIVILAHAPKPLGDDDFDARIAALSGPQPLLYLDGVQNPHNVGSITRLAAHFGVPLILGKDKELPRLSPSAARVAEGAAEHVPFVVLKDPDLAFSKLKKKGYKVVVTSSHASTSLYDAKLPPKVLLVFGGESAGASARVTKLADLQINVPGTGAVESLNVAVAAGLFLGEFWRAHKV